ncbi:flagella basal body P-ring formation protein FlgA [Tepidamorphus gemmatus]|jgi:flagella basal body P-ring formation protein FlgA|uniref:Flagella basal body P-ring formation protein FlgA n=1 Tax=Tepidamorphus gemmatus TaxID=747076 RepID=A0A4R3M093_9HYPH|nr:flagellar basal body P-ring formation chaperone FlgA [Tepidamorphus gemmatus]TCT06474.1 flagella basal body P-ring formation protein FlgA [Tepidamorphus gemmatus]
MIIRTLVVGAALAAVVFALPARSDEMPRLRAAITVHGTLVTLADLIENAGAAGDTAVFRSPEPGTTGTVRVDRVLAAAAAKGLTNVDSAGVLSVSVTRAGRIISAEEMTDAIRRRLTAGVSGRDAADLDISIDGQGQPIAIESTATAPLSVADLQHDARTGRFSALLKVSDSEVIAAGIRVSGRAVEIVEVPVLVRAIERGETIGPSDLAAERMPRHMVRGDVLTDPAAIAGMSARRRLPSGSVLSGDMLMEPLLVQRNGMVTIAYSVPGMTLTTRGRALSNGARGEVVKVFNLQSGRTIEAEVIGEGLVAVMPQRRPMAALSVSAN